jgi:pilus assembly protein Flp/PilA
LTFTEERHVRKFSQALVSFLRDESGPTAVEYAVMLALIIVVCILSPV